MLPLFDPRLMLKRLALVVAPLRYLVYAVPVLLLVAIVLAVNNWHPLSSDLGTLHAHFAVRAHHLHAADGERASVVLVMSFVANAFRVSVDKVGITVLLGFIPRFTTHMTGTDQLPAAAKPCGCTAPTSCCACSCSASRCWSGGTTPATIRVCLPPSLR